MALINIDDKKMREEFPEVDVNTVATSGASLTPSEKINFFAWLFEHKIVMVCGIAVIILIALAVVGLRYLNSTIVSDDHEHVYVNHICKYCDKEETYDIVYTDESGSHTISYSYLTEKITTPKLTQKLGYSAKWGEVIDENGTKTVQAVYTIIDFKINYHIDVEGIENDKDNPATYTVKDSVEFKDIVAEGYYFGGWYTDSEYKTKIANINYGSTGELDLYAKITSNQTLISFNLNAGSGNVPQVSIPALETYTFEEVDVTRRAYKFIGWSIVKDGEVKYRVGDTYKAQAANVKVTLYAVWEKNKTIITFNPNGGEGEETTQEFQCFIPTKIKDVTFTRNAATLAGWATEPTGEIVYKLEDSYTAGEEETTLTLYAKWKTNCNNISFDSNGGIGLMSSVSIESLTSAALPQNTFTYEGSKFIGWSTTKDGNVEYKDKGIYLATGEQADITFYAIWAVNNEITIKFNNNGGVGYASDLTVELLNTVSLPTSGFTKPGLTFAGWALSSLGDIVYTDSYTYNTRILGSVIELYAVYTENRTTIIFKANGGQGEMENQEISAGYNAYINENTFTYPGYKFLGWSYSKDGTVDIYDKSYYEAPNRLVTFELYAVWERNITTIVFVKNGSTGAMLNQEIPAGTPTNLSSNKFTKTNCYFAGWATESTGEIVYKDAAEYTPGNENVTVYLYAIFRTNRTIFHYDANGGSGEMTDSDILYNTKGNLKECEFTNQNYSFIGWCLDQVYEGQDLYPANYEYTALEDFREVTLYAIWRKNKTTIEFKSNYTTDQMDTIEVSAGEQITLPANTYTRIGYSFSGWSINTEGIAEYGDCDTFTGYSENVTITLVPTWEINKVILTFNPNGGNGYIEAMNLNAFQKVYLPECTFTKENMHFIGWGVGTREYANYEAGEEYITPETSGEVIVYAIWDDNVQPLTLVYNNGTTTQEQINFDVVNGGKINIIPEKENYEFLGWSESQDATQATYGADDFVVLGIKDDYILYGVFREYVGTIGLVYDAIYDNGVIVSYEVVNYSGSEENVIIPGVYNNKNIVRIKDNAFANNNVIKTVKLVNNITEIGDSAFANCSKLVSIDLGTKLVKINDNAFYGSSIETITLPNTVTTVGNNTFNSCTNLTEITLSTGMTNIPEGMLMNSGIVSITIPSNINTINVNAFRNCTNLTTITFNEGLVTIGNYAFNGCDSLTVVNLPNSLKTIGKYTFADCDTLETVTFGSQLETIGSYAFSNDSEIESLTISHINLIGEYAFSNTGLVDVTISGNLLYVNKGMFANCKALTNVVLPSTVEIIFTNAFYNCLQLTKIVLPENLKTIQSKAFELSAINTLFYASNQTNWATVSVASDAYAATTAVLYYSATQPTENYESYWHYNEDNNPRKWTI